MAYQTSLFHLYFIMELYSNADGTVQFIELRGRADGEDLLGAHTLVSRQGTVSRSFTFDSNLPNSATFFKSVLIATPGFADLGIVEPDYIMPAGFLFTSGAAVLDFGEGAAIFNYSSLPLDGEHSLDRSGLVQLNSPTNFAGDTGTIVASSNAEPAVAHPLADRVVGATQLLDFTIAQDTFTDADGDALTLSAGAGDGGALPGYRRRRCIDSPATQQQLQEEKALPKGGKAQWQSRAPTAPTDSTRISRAGSRKRAGEPTRARNPRRSSRRSPPTWWWRIWKRCSAASSRRAKT